MRLRDRGLDARHVVDVEACQGDWTRLCRRVFPQARVLMVKPQERHRERLRQMVASDGGGLAFASVLLGPAGMALADFHVLGDPSGGTGSSVLPEGSAGPRQVVRMPVRTLDEVLAQHAMQPVSLLNLDVQGFDLGVLKGADQILATVPWVLLEVSLTPYNQGSPLIDEVLSWMRARGFGIAEVVDLSRARDGRLVQADLLFQRLATASGH
jgi:FkbM family methyltransferase